MRYDAIIVGSGQAGNPLAFALADRGWKVALVERDKLGGTCINTGCTPTKAMVHRAQIAHYARSAARWGVQTGEIEVDLPKIVAQKDALLEDFRSSIQDEFDKRPALELILGAASFDNAGKIAIGSRVIESDKIFLDVGTRPHIPDIPGLGEVDYLTNVSILDLLEIPEHLVVLGGGYVGLEFGQMFRRFGSQVTIVHSGSQIVPREDAEIAQELQRALETEGIIFTLEAKTKSAKSNKGKIALTADTPAGEIGIEGSHLLVATGRRPNTEDLGLDKAGIETDQNGFIRVNSKLETSAPGVWAMGDVRGHPFFTHMSFNDYQIVYGNVVEEKSLSTEGRLVPYCVFTDPQLGGVGLTEREARAKGSRLKIGRLPMSRVARAIERDETAGLMKIVVDADTDKVLGASILGSEGGEIVQILSTIMLADKPYTLLKGAIFIHPTLAEGFWKLMEEVEPVE